LKFKRLSAMIKIT